MPQKRRRGAQPGNENALKHGRNSKKRTDERRAAWEAECAARRRSEAEWAAKMPKTDYTLICAQIAASKATKH